MADIAICSIIILFSAFFYRETLSYASIPGYERMGPEVWPQFLLIAIAILSVLIIIGAVRKQKKNVTVISEPQREKKVTDVIIFVIFVFLVNLLFPYLGFLLASFLGMLIFLYLLGEKNKFSILSFSFFSVLTIYFFFAKILLVPLPRGVSIFREFSYFLY